MKVNRAGLGAVFVLYDHENEGYTHRYVIVGVNKKKDVGFVQCMSITSMYNKQVTTEVPVVINNVVGYIAPYNIHSFKENNFRNENFSGVLTEGLVPEFIELLLDIYKDVNLYGFKNKEFHEDVKRRYNAYIDDFLKENENIKEYRMGKDEALKNDSDAVFKKIWYNNEIPDETNETKEDTKKPEVHDSDNIISISDTENTDTASSVPSVVDKEVIINNKQLEDLIKTEVDKLAVSKPNSLTHNCKKLSDIGLVSYYYYFCGMKAADYKKIFKVDKTQAFYNRKHALKREILLRLETKTMRADLYEILQNQSE